MKNPKKLIWHRVSEVMRIQNRENLLKDEAILIYEHYYYIVRRDVIL